MNDLAPYRLIGTPRFGGILVVVDHASNHVPGDVDLGIAAELLDQHMAYDIGTQAVAQLLCERPGFAAFCATTSRLVCDLNRDEDAPCLIPMVSDGHEIAGNVLDATGRQARVARFHRPYHAALAALLDKVPPALILSLHSFTPRLASDPAQARPWHIGVLYNQDDRAARLALPLLRAENGLCVGDQKPYSGRELNYTMDRHAEAEGRPHLGVEVRQDLIADSAGQAQWAERLARVCNRVAVAV